MVHHHICPKCKNPWDHIVYFKCTIPHEFPCETCLNKPTAVLPKRTRKGRGGRPPKVKKPVKSFLGF